MNKKFLTLFVISTLAMATSLCAIAAPWVEVEEKDNSNLKTEIQMIEESPLGEASFDETVELTKYLFNELKSKNFNFIPELISLHQNDGTQKEYWVMVSADNKVIFKAESIEPVDKYVKAPSGLNIRTSPIILKNLSNRFKVISYGKKLSVIGVSEDGWALVKIDEKMYFCKDAYLSLEKPEEKVEKTKVSNKKQTSYTKGEGTSSLGTYSLTAYCSCSKCCGKWAGGKTASGTIPTQGRTVACNSLPFGTKISINGNIYTVEDTGNMSDNVIDIYFNSHSEALQFGRQKAEVFLVK